MGRGSSSEVSMIYYIPPPPKSKTPHPEHCDGPYINPDGRERTFYTLHLYLNDSDPASTAPSDPYDPSAPAAAPFPELLIQGGATTFHSHDDITRRLDVSPKAGRVLIFQHRGLLHSGDEVLEGVKYTMRTDLLFEFEEEREE